MDRPKPLDATAEDWLWLQPWATVPECNWSAVIHCLREAARVEHQQDYAEWADLIEALTPARLQDGVAGQPSESSALKAECH